MTSELVRLVLARRPIDTGRMRREHAALCEMLQQRMVPLGCARVILAEVYDQHFGALHEWAAFIRGPIRAGLVARFMSFFVGPGSQRSTAEAAARMWTLCHFGLSMVVAYCDDDTARLLVKHPPYLIDELARIEACELVRLTLDLCGTVADPVTEGVKPDCFCVEVRWSNA